MPSNTSSANRMSLSSSSVHWEQFMGRAISVLAKVPLERWQLVVRLGLILLLSLSLAQLFWMILPSPKITPAVIALPKATAQVVGGDKSINIAQLKSIAVFGKADAPKATGTPESQAVDTHLNLVLLGVIVSSDEKAARAIITVGDKAEIFAIDQALPVGNGVTLSKVMADRAIVNNNGQFETLWLYTNDPNNAISQVHVAPPREELTPQNYGPQPSDPALANVSHSLSDVVAMSVYRENGQVAGYKIRPGRDAEKFRTLGLQADDVVTSINGMPLSNPAKIMEMYKNMGNITSATLEIKRGGSIMKIDVVL